MRAGVMVKIEDIGPLATCIQVAKHMVKLDLEGEQFWIDSKFLEVVEGGDVGCLEST